MFFVSKKKYNTVLEALEREACAREAAEDVEKCWREVVRCKDQTISEMEYHIELLTNQLEEERDDRERITDQLTEQVAFYEERCRYLEDELTHYQEEEV